MARVISFEQMLDIQSQPSIGNQPCGQNGSQCANSTAACSEVVMLVPNRIKLADLQGMPLKPRTYCIRIFH